MTQDLSHYGAPSADGTSWVDAEVPAGLEDEKAAIKWKGLQRQA